MRIDYFALSPISPTTRVFDTCIYCVAIPWHPFLAPLPFLGCHVHKLLLLWHPVLAPVPFLGCRVHVLLLLLLLWLCFLAPLPFLGCCAFWLRCLFRCCCGTPLLHQEGVVTVVPTRSARRQLQPGQATSDPWKWREHQEAGGDSAASREGQAGRP